MTYDVIVAPDRELLTTWLADADRELAGLSDLASVRHRKVLALGVLRSEDAFDRVSEYVTQVLAVAADVPSAQSARDKMSEGLRELRKTGLTAAPDGDSPWFDAFGKVYEGADEVRAASLATAATYEKLEDARRILGQIAGDGGVNTLLVLRKNQAPVAMAAVRGMEESSKEIIIADLVASPVYIAGGGTGVGSVAAEYVIREAKRRNASLSLIALGDKVRAIYTHWGFVGAGDSMSMSSAAMDQFLTTHKVLESQ
ncbi:GNAT family N-acetyltransferase [Kibdelosporangium phytohabitans]|uniref:Uncharacterized protein n=1 Tax=Kibdelosporangium phytohabitans TaxID=860235 RepID=A0A0N9I460_9PSEU|nr:GNAT family N-acetyltransferase [Kibdelosporangium phytohabitans]ALG09318.1 hypothetical protein AOZ06_22555 [Kibdelosporangium phytohabitans]MBE1469422.1 hypothetical protein [Kibdelosporangium phytohabitans]